MIKSPKSFKTIILALIAIFSSQLFAQTVTTPEKAVEIVWKALGRSPRKNSFLDFDREENRAGKNYYVLQGYNRVKDPRDGTSQTSTWGWFFVDAKTGQPYELDYAEDVLRKIK